MASWAWLDASWFNHPISRPVTLRRWFNIPVLVLGVVYIILITLANVIAVGYETVATISSQYQNNMTLWYEHPLPNFAVNALLPETRKCTASTIKVNEGSSPFDN